MAVEFDPRPFWKPRDLAEMLAVSPSQIYRLIEDGKLDHVKVGERTVRVPAASVAAYLGLDVPAAPSPASITDLEGQMKAFKARTGHEVGTFVDAWRREAIPDTGENNALALEALALREARARQAVTV